jgi:hypothetical protein
MRTTLTIDDDVATALKDLARNSGKTFKAVVNEVMRRGLMTGEKPVPDRELHSNDADFARFSGLTWRNPIA